MTCPSKSWLPALCLTLLAAVLALVLVEAPAAAQQRAYAPDDLRTLSYDDQARVISLEYQEQSGGRRIPDDQLQFYLDQVNRSNWRFSQIKADIAVSLGGSAPPATGTVRCESINGRAQICRVPWSGSSRLVRQLSNAPCAEGRSWQSQPGQVYVGNNCRGEFASAGATPGPGPVGPGGPIGQGVVCESINNQARICRVPWSGPSRLARQSPGSQPCIEGQTWQSQNGQVYVGRGCRAEFVAAGAVQPPIGPQPGGPSVVCTSVDGRAKACPWPAGTGSPRLLQQLSSQTCVQGRTWGFTGSAIWVSQGCSGRFGY
ncbi:DUF3011 domain-containing protein [Lysobacter sp. S4-A87]|uniref:DUF3011 domain-containing protein n=1 Tax=Lysobacter sp. S4-A87 TaxID=2925843 RepID=UPI001F5348E2|nr:DUF3011 domain-containing protein [Lysobacter sp. S4-A87]UNK49006.1 DUF3011 domain-containing protein [Lysobacter sp. S4-A87]